MAPQLPLRDQLLKTALAGYLRPINMGALPSRTLSENFGDLFRPEELATRRKILTSVILATIELPNRLDISWFRCLCRYHNLLVHVQWPCWRQRRLVTPEHS